MMMRFFGENEDAILAAVKFIQAETADFLLKKGANLGESFFHETYLAKAADLGHSEVMRVLLQHGASISLALESARKEYLKRLDILFHNSKGTDLQESIKKLKESYTKQIELLLDHAAGHDLADENYSNFATDFQFLEDFDFDVGRLSFIGVSYNSNFDLAPVFEKFSHLEEHLKKCKEFLFKYDEIETINDETRRLRLKANIEACKKERGFEITENGLLNLLPLWRAARTGNHITVQTRLLAHVNPNESSPSGVSPIEYAAEIGDAYSVEMLANHPKIDKSTFVRAITKARQHKHEEIVRYLTPLCNINLVDSKGQGLLHHAIKLGDVEWIEALIKMGANVNHFDNEEASPLIVAIKDSINNQVALQIIKILLANKANPNLQRGFFSPIMWAIQPHEGAKSCLDIVELLLSVIDKKPIRRENEARQEVYDDPWYTDLLFFAYRSKNPIENLTLLKKYGADFSVRDKYHDETLLHIAVRECKIPLIIFLLKNGADPHVCARNNSTPLQLLNQAQRIDDKGKNQIKNLMIDSIFKKETEFNIQIISQVFANSPQDFDELWEMIFLPTNVDRYNAVQQFGIYKQMESSLSYEIYCEIAALRNLINRFPDKKDFKEILVGVIKEKQNQQANEAEMDGGLRRKAPNV